jgi:hypothetical protein
VAGKTIAKYITEEKKQVEKNDTSDPISATTSDVTSDVTSDAKDDRFLTTLAVSLSKEVEIPETK